MTFIQRGMITWAVLCTILIFNTFSAQAQQTDSNPQVQLDTSMGAIVIELYPLKAPDTVKNFLSYVRSGFYDETIFHRVIKGFMIQGGGFTAGMQQKPTQPPVQNEADNGLKNSAGTIAMARTANPHSATSQFFINAKDNSFLDHTAKSSNGWGYCVFGRVIEGLDVVQKIEQVATTQRSGHGDVPAESVIIKSAKVIIP